MESKFIAFLIGKYYYCRSTESDITQYVSFHGENFILIIFPFFREHVIKNARCDLFNQWKNGFKYQISEAFFQKYQQSHGLVTRDVDWGHFIELHKFDEPREHKYAPRVTAR